MMKLCIPVAALVAVGALMSVSAGYAQEASAAFAAKATKPARADIGPSPEIAALIGRHAAANGVPVELAHRIIMKESRFNPSARNRVYLGLMQIRHETAQGVGYRGPADGLLNADTNLRYGMVYLGNAYRVAGGDQRRTMQLYASGFHYEAKRKGMLAQMRRAPSHEGQQVAER